MGTLAYSEDPNEMPHKTAFHFRSALFAQNKTIFKDRNTSYFRNWEIGPVTHAWTIQNLLYGYV